MEKFHLSLVLERNLNEKGFNIDVINASVSGDTTSGGLNRLDGYLKKRKGEYYNFIPWGQ